MPHLDAGAPLRPETVSGKRWLRPLVWRRLPWYLELAIIAVGYAVYSRIRVAAPAKESVAMFHADQVEDLERLFRIDIELVLNKLVASSQAVMDVFSYHYGTLHFFVTPAILLWLYFCRPAMYPRLRSTIFVATFAALCTYWAWPLAPPRFALDGAVDTVVKSNVWGSGDPNSGLSGMVNLYAAMPSLHVGWAIWCAVAITMTTRGRWRKLVWLYPLSTTLVVVGTGNHYVLDAVGGAAIVALGLYVTRPYAVRLRPVPPRESIVTKPALLADAPTVDTHVLDVTEPGVVVHRPSEPDDVVDLRVDDIRERGRRDR